jgi:hypothetical protein
MTKKDFTLLAHALWAARMEGRLSDTEATRAAHALVPHLKGTNRAFDSERFMLAVTGDTMP